MGRPRTGVVVLVSGSGSNLQALIDARARGELPVDLLGVVSNRPGVRGLERAQAAGIPTEVLDHRPFAERADYDARLQTCIDAMQPDLVVLAGFMRILTDAFVGHYRGRMLNIHPSLLPALRGLHTHERALADGHREHGCSVHFVTPALDAGPVVAQGVVPVAADDDPQRLAARVQAQEHRVYPLVVRWFAEGRLALQGEAVELDGATLERPLRIHPDAPLPE